MRIIEQEETTLSPTEVTEVKEQKESPKSSFQKEMFNIAKQIHELGNKLLELITKYED